MNTLWGNKSKKIVYIGLFVALYVVLSLYCSISLGSIHITIGSFPIVLGALMFGPRFAATVGLIGELCKQLTTYGLSYTTPLYIIPPALRGLIVGLMPNKPYLAGVIAAVVVTIANTLVNLIDSLIFRYYTLSLIFGTLVYRLVLGIVTSVVVMKLAIILRRRLV